MKVTKAFTLDESVFEDLKKYAELDCRKNSDFLNQTLIAVFAKMKEESSNDRPGH